MLVDKLKSKYNIIIRYLPLPQIETYVYIPLFFHNPLKQGINPQWR